MSAKESPIVFECSGDRLIGMLHPGHEDKKTGIIIVVGGPQYRVGSHRQFVVIARQISAAGYPVLRFDYRGMGDAEGAVRSFEEVDDDIRAAIDVFLDKVPGLDKVVLLGLCDAASAALICCTSDDRLTGLILLNPWVRTEQGEANAYLHHYYGKRLLQKSFWIKVLTGKYSVGKSLREFFSALRLAKGKGNSSGLDSQAGNGSFVARMLTGIANFGGPILLLTSGRDLTAQEFVEMSRRSEEWRRVLGRSHIRSVTFPDADHTMSARSDLNAACEAALGWLTTCWPVTRQ